jgi:hypothetical protein
MKASVAAAAPGEKLAGPRNKEGIKFVSAFGSTHTLATELIELVHTPVQMAILKLTLAEKMTSDPHPSIAPAPSRKANECARIMGQRAHFTLAFFHKIISLVARACR